MERSEDAGSAGVCSGPIRLDTPDGPLSAFLASPDGTAWKSGVVVVGESGALSVQLRDTCCRLAEAGHGALALDLEVASLGGPLVMSDASAAGLTRCTRAVGAAAGFLRSEAPTALSRLGVVGFGTGGLVALAAGYRCQVGTAVSFYGEGPMRLRANLREIIDAPKPHAATLVCLVGGEDEDVRPADLGAIRDHLDAFGMRQTSIVYPRTRAGFCHPEGRNYRAAEAEDAWGRLLHALETATRQRHRFSAKSPTTRTRVSSELNDAFSADEPKS